MAAPSAHAVRRPALRLLSAIALMATAVLPAALPGSARADEAASAPRLAVPEPTVQGPLPGRAPGDPKAPDISDTYPFFSTDVDLAAEGYVEEEFTFAGRADGYSVTGEQVGTDVPYTSRMIVRRPKSPRAFNGTVIVEWQNVSAGYDLDALWNYKHLMREGYAWVGVSAQRAGVNQLKGWSPARYGTLDVTGAGQFNADELSYEVFAQAAQAIKTRRGGVEPLGKLRPHNLVAVGASQSAGRMSVYYDAVLPQTGAVFDGYGFIVGSAPSRRGPEPIFHVLSETDVRSPVRAPDTSTYRRWEVAGAAHSGWNGAEYRQSISVRDLGAVPEYDCTRPPYSRVPLQHVTGAAYDHLKKWVEKGVQPPKAPPLEFNEDGTKARDELGLAKGGIRLSQLAVPTALNTGDNGGETFCVLFGTYDPFGEEQLDALYPTRTGYVARVALVDLSNVVRGYIDRADARDNLREAVHSGVGR